MKASPGTLAEVLVVGTEAFQQARAALNHLPGQGVASQVRWLRACAFPQVLRHSSRAAGSGRVCGMIATFILMSCFCSQSSCERTLQAS